MTESIKAKGVRLTKKQREVVNDLQDGFVLVTSNEFKGAWVSKAKQPKADYHIDNGIFRRLVDKGIIFQQLNHPHDYILTKLGRTI